MKKIFTRLSFSPKNFGGFILSNFSKRNLGGFTLIEILIVVAIIGILASTVLVGLRPAQMKGRDARRIADLRNVQTALELYFSKCGFYPGDAEPTIPCASEPGTGSSPINISELKTILSGSEIGVKSIPNDPDTSRYYQYSSDGNEYVLAATLDDSSNPVLNDDFDNDVLGVNCGDPVNDTVYCIQL